MGIDRNETRKKITETTWVSNPDKITEELEYWTNIGVGFLSNINGQASTIDSTFALSLTPPFPPYIFNTFKHFLLWSLLII